MDDQHFSGFAGDDCTRCHGGVEPATDRKTAHEGMIAASDVCADCHADEAETFASGLHAENRGIVDPVNSQVALRADPAKIAELTEAIGNHCSSCHIRTCGDCHVSRPQFNDGGLVKGHVFYREPKPTSNCTGCHGSRIEKEMLAKGGVDADGNAVNTMSDVHWSPGGMTCEKCHTMHRDGEGANYRYDMPGTPRCEDCHPEVATDTGNTMHAMHASPGQSTPHLQCQVCHSQPYNNCSGCHVQKSDDGVPYYEIDPSWFDFKIGRNPIPSAQRPYDYVLVRHVPVARDSFAYYGDDILSNYDAVPTWKYATPHNIRTRIRVDGEDVLLPQIQSCDESCHDNTDLFLTADDVDPDELQANADVMIETVN